MARREGMYSHLCSQDDIEKWQKAENAAEAVCDEQELKLNLPFTVASTLLSVMTLVWGTIVDKYGPVRITKCPNL